MRKLHVQPSASFRGVNDFFLHRYQLNTLIHCRKPEKGTVVTIAGNVGTVHGHVLFGNRSWLDLKFSGTNELSKGMPLAPSDNPSLRPDRRKPSLYKCVHILKKNICATLLPKQYEIIS